MEEHWNDEQVEEFLRNASQRKDGSNAGRTALNAAMEHLHACEGCQTRVAAQVETMEKLSLLRVQTLADRGLSCPPADVWVGIAAGTIVNNAEMYLAHAAECDACGPLLHQAFADCSDELSAEEETMIANLDSSSVGWQRKLAFELAGTAMPPEEKPRTAARASWLAILSSRRLIYACTVVALVTTVFWYGLRWQKDRTALGLLASAYVEKRSIEVRLEGVPFAPLRQDRGGGPDRNRMNRPALLKAEAAIAIHLHANADDVEWLQASGRAGLLEGDEAGIEQAIAALSKARDRDPGNQSVVIDLASAYLLRGESTGSHGDIGTAIDLLERVRAAEPQNETALFNDAIALEKHSLNKDAEHAWEIFLEKFSSSPWASEARERLARLQKIVEEHKWKSDQPLHSAEEVAAAMNAHMTASIEAIDARVEDYQDVALQQWLPAYYGARSWNTSNAESNRVALFGLAALLEDRHGDSWLKDMLATWRDSVPLQGAMASLAESERLIQKSDDDRAEKAAHAASVLFKGEGITAGVLRAQLSLAMIYQLQHDARKCSIIAHQISTDPNTVSYPWLLAQSKLEEAACASTSDERALMLTQSAKSMAELHRFPVTRIRAANFEAGTYEAMGNRHQAWEISAESLDQFWKGQFRQLRGYNLLTNLDYLAEEQEQWFLETALAKEAVPMIDSHPNLAMRAAEQARLGEAQLRCGDIKGAESSFHTAEELFSKTPKSARRDALSAETEIGLARAELGSNRMAEAVRRLERIRSTAVKVPDDDLQLDFFRTSGIAEMRSGMAEQSRADLHAAIKLAEQGLTMVGDEADRWKWRRKNEPEYRALVELDLRSDPVQALTDWEQFKGATLASHGKLRNSKAVVEMSSGGAVSSFQDDLESDTVLVSYALFGDAASVWVVDRSRIQQKWFSLSGLQLSLLTRSFLEHCSNPGSDPERIRQESAMLYKVIFLSVEPWVAGHRKLVVEPDGDLRSIPFEILTDSHQRYLGDQYAVTISPGAGYLKSSRKWTGITVDSDASVVGNPEASGWISLPEAEQEARAVAGLFTHAHLMLHQADSGESIPDEINRVLLFHFSGHASNSAVSSGLVIGGGTVFNAFRLKQSNPSRTQLVVLSACNSALGSNGFFDDEDSFVRKLSSGRVPSIVASRWSVDSVATAALMKAFYSQLLAGNSPSSAMASARAALRSEPQFAHPFYWAGFSVFGRS